MAASIDFESLVLQFRLSEYAALVGLTVWALDVLLTLDEELKLLWSRNGPLIKFLYLINRYLPIVGVYLFMDHQSLICIQVCIDYVMQSSEHLNWNYIPRCQLTFSISVFTQVMQVIAATSIFVLRLCVVYHSQIIIRRLLLASLLLSHVTMFIFYAFAMHNLLPGMIWHKILHMCLFPSFSTWPIAGMYLTPLFIDSLVFLATVYHAFQYHRGNYGWITTSTTSVLNTLYINGSLYYLIILHLRVGSVLVYFFAPLGYQLLFCYLEYSVSSALTSRWFLSFRRTILNSMNPDTFSSTSVVTDDAISIPTRKHDWVNSSGRRHPDRDVSNLVLGNRAGNAAGAFERHALATICHSPKVADGIGEKQSTHNSEEFEADKGAELTQSDIFEMISRLGSEGSLGDLSWA
ncbi:hypothetical protein CPB86DRAFT_817137 [Serendipita vermifera]|nr:hypothetical protein CPB86DRAFT_817137 [Serendipita vermifera]